ncbi:fructose-6-phosphate aldolase [Exiguobacterium sp. s189]|uniref:fructose-6-phosphate aldolase n=1 Tax=Exiguobacterium sp. s189 TaxID=2751263 RepID=UPI001BE62BE9|nr:fructose-6-phosphate aldolase [Exiguobacterium sp. s189]
MLYYLDTASIEQIKKAFDYYPMAGVTTNPTIISKEKTAFLPLLQEIRSVIGMEADLHVQVLGQTAETMVAEAKYLKEKIGGELVIKIPVIPEGIKAMKWLSREGFRITATAIYTADQALMAAMAGAEFLAPYVNRIDNISGNGVAVVRQIQTMLNQHELDAKILAASFKNNQQVHEVALAGAQSVTVNADIMDQLLAHPLTTSSVSQFVSDWEAVYGESTIIDPVR